jgi:hydrogenase-4 component F
MDKIRGLIKGNPVVGWAFMFGAIALVGMPPFGLFTSEFLILTATIKEAPLLTPLLLLGLGVAFAAIFRKVQPMVTGVAPPWQTPLKAAHVPVLLHMTLVLILGLYMPRFLSDWFHLAVRLLQ